MTQPIYLTPINTNYKVRLIFTPYRLTKKDKRHSGWVTPTNTIKAKKEEILNECLDPQPYWSDWDDWRDGMRHSNLGDGSKILPNYCCTDWCRENFKIDERNIKNKKLLKRRKLMNKKRKLIEDYWHDIEEINKEIREIKLRMMAEAV